MPLTYHITKIGDDDRYQLIGHGHCGNGRDALYHTGTFDECVAAFNQRDFGGRLVVSRYVPWETVVASFNQDLVIIPKLWPTTQTAVVRDLARHHATAWAAQHTWKSWDERNSILSISERKLLEFAFRVCGVKV